MVGSRFEPGAAGRKKAQKNPLSYGAPPPLLKFSNKTFYPNTKVSFVVQTLPLGRNFQKEYIAAAINRFTSIHRESRTTKVFRQMELQCDQMLK